MNKIIFDSDHGDIDQCYSFFKNSVQDIRHRAKPSPKKEMQDWLDPVIAYLFYK
jgi:hypothetical protein